jgi:NADH dehydrogenase FAD-containing subunit
VLVGAGHAHLHVIASAQHFRRAGHELVVIAPEPFWYSGLATGVVGGLYPPELDRIDIAALAGQHGARFVQDRAVGLDLARRLVLLESTGPVSFDALSINLGSATPELPGSNQPGVYSVKPISRLAELRADLEERFIAAMPVRLVIGGGGATAAELAANIAALASRAGAEVDITLLAAGTSAFQHLPRGAARSLARSLEARGVEIPAAKPDREAERGEGGAGQRPRGRVRPFPERRGSPPRPHPEAVRARPGPPRRAHRRRLSALARRSGHPRRR